jgi:hypothetical protein
LLEEHLHWLAVFSVPVVLPEISANFFSLIFFFLTSYFCSFDSGLDLGTGRLLRQLLEEHLHWLAVSLVPVILPEISANFFLLIFFFPNFVFLLLRFWLGPGY